MFIIFIGSLIFRRGFYVINAPNKSLIDSATYLGNTISHLVVY